MTSENKSNPYIIQSVEKALKVLKTFDINNLEQSLKEITDRLEYNKSNVLRIMETLKEEGFVVEDAASKKYKLGIELFHLGNCVFDSMSIKKIAAPYMQEASNTLGVVTHIGSLENKKVIVIDKLWPTNKSYSIRMFSEIGGSVPVHCTGIGKVLLAYKSTEERSNILGNTPLKAYTDHTITDRKKLSDELDKTRLRGYAQNNMEHENYIKCITYPIFNYENKAMYGLSFTGLAQLMDEMDPEVIHRIAKETATAISKELGSSLFD